MTSALHRIACLILTSALFMATGCKPATTPGSGHTSSSSDDPTPPAGGGTPGQPSANDLAKFFRSLLPPTAHLVEAKMEQPMRMPNTSSASNTWLLNVKITVEPTEDMLGTPTEQDANAFKAVADELNGLVQWREAYVHSPYAHLYPGFEVKSPASPTPQLLVVLHKGNQPLPAIYGKMAAEWQVDHWNFSRVDLDLPDLGQPRSAFEGSTMVKGSKEAEAFLTAEHEAIAQAKQKKAAIESSYAADLVKATQPGTIYRGQLSYGSGTTPAEVHFVKPTADDPQCAQLELRLPSAPTYLFTYGVKLAQRLPVWPSAATGADGAVPVSDDSSAMPKRLSNNGVLRGV